MAERATGSSRQVTTRFPIGVSDGLFVPCCALSLPSAGGNYYSFRGQGTMMWGHGRMNPDLIFILNSSMCAGVNVCRACFMIMTIIFCSQASCRVSCSEQVPQAALTGTCLAAISDPDSEVLQHQGRECVCEENILILILVFP